MGLFDRSNELISQFETLSQKQQLRIDALEKFISSLQMELQSKDGMIDSLNKELQHKDNAFMETVAQMYTDEFKPLQDKVEQLEKDNKLLKVAGRKVNETNKKLIATNERLASELETVNKDHAHYIDADEEVKRLKTELDILQKRLSDKEAHYVQSLLSGEIKMVAYNSPEYATLLSEYIECKDKYSALIWSIEHCNTRTLKDIIKESTDEEKAYHRLQIIGIEQILNYINSCYEMDEQIYYDYYELLLASKKLLEFYESKQSEQISVDDVTEIINTNDLVETEDTIIKESGQEKFLKRLNEIYKKH